MGVVCSSGAWLTVITVDIGEESGDSKPGSDDTPPVLSVSDVAATLVGDRGRTLLVAKSMDWGRLCPGVVCEVLGAVDDGEIEGRVEEEGRGKEEESLVRFGSDDVVSKWDVDSIKEDVSSDDANADSTGVGIKEDVSSDDDDVTADSTGVGIKDVSSDDDDVGADSTGVEIKEDVSSDDVGADSTGVEIKEDVNSDDAPKRDEDSPSGGVEEDTIVCVDSIAVEVASTLDEVSGNGRREDGVID